jgi:alkylhydroperoxidase/carboxymuconolactone decarboxylase family protein YurZ
MAEGTDRVAWVDLPSAEEIRDRIPADTPIAYDINFLPAMARLSRGHPRLAAPFSALSHAIMFGPGYLTRAEREMVASVAAAAQDCHY